jgi:hypothetical protein
LATFKDMTDLTITIVNSNRTQGGYAGHGLPSLYSMPLYSML